MEDSSENSAIATDIRGTEIEGNNFSTRESWEGNFKSYCWKKLHFRSRIMLASRQTEHTTVVTCQPTLLDCANYNWSQLITQGHQGKAIMLRRNSCFSSDCLYLKHVKCFHFFCEP